MITSPDSDITSYLTLDDQEWLACFRGHVRSRTLFMMSVWLQTDDLINHAGAVTIWHKGKFQSVRELVEECASHGWNGTIYEAWVWETSNRVRELLWTLFADDDAAAEAIEIYARHLDPNYFEASYGEAMEAIAEAQRWQDGEC